ncbi:MAG: hypothetical protein U9Q07_03200 [Planctomycetota bacterium]|nr:hypothetical protein [Planctomycetota bacterium]
MAWIKMQTDLSRKPNILLICRILAAANAKLTQGPLATAKNSVLEVDELGAFPFSAGNRFGVSAVLGALFRLWSLADEQSEDGILDGYTAQSLDSEVGISGFAEALADERIGWLAIHDDCIQVLDFDKHNGESAKRRAATAKRVAKYESTKKGKATNAGTVSKLTQEPLARVRVRERVINNKDKTDTAEMTDSAKPAKSKAVERKAAEKVERETIAKEIAREYRTEIKDGKDDTFTRAWRHLTAILEIHTPEVVRQSITNYAEFCSLTSRGVPYRKMAGNFYGQDATWEEYTDENYTKPNRRRDNGRDEPIPGQSIFGGEVAGIIFPEGETYTAYNDEERAAIEKAEREHATTP